MIPKNKTIAFYTFGCKVNQYDTQRLRALFKATGWKEVDKQTEAEVYVINTCTVTADSDRKARQLIRSLARNHPNAEIIVTGCYAESQPAELQRLPNITFILGNQQKEQIPIKLQQRYQIIPKHQKEINSTITEFAGHTRVFVKVQDGCNGQCAYCIVPQVRGEPKSRPQNEIIQEVELLAKKGYKEIVLAGIRLGIYGKDNYATPGSSLSSLISKLAQIQGIYRMRLSSIEPMDIDLPTLLNLLNKEPKLCHHLHIPLQSGDDAILSAMQRTYSIKEFEHLIRSIRASFPDIAITTDMIVAFPGETEFQFQHSAEMLIRIGFAKSHIFRYSARPGTRAKLMTNQIDAITAKHRARILIQHAASVALRYQQTWINKTVEVLVEERRDRKTGLLTGLTSHYQRVNFFGGNSLYNQLVSVTIEGIKDNYLFGKYLK